MKNDKKTKKQLINELVDLRQQIAKLEKSETDRKQVEQTIRLQCEIAGNMAQSVLLIRASNGMIVYTNQKFEEMFGYSQGELVGKHISVLNAACDISPEKTAEEIIRSIKENGVWHGEVLNKKRDGTPFWCRVSISTLEDPEYGEIWVSINEDITEHKEAEENYRAIFENTGTAIAIDEEDTTISLINTECEILFGYLKEEIEGKKSWIELIHKDDLEKVKEYHRLRRIDPKAAPRNYELRSIDRYGNVKNIFATVVMIPGTKKSVGSFIDITECKRAEEALKEKEGLYRTFINFTSDIVFLKDEQLRNIIVNKALLESLGVGEDQVIGKTDFELLPESVAEGCRQTDMKALESGDVVITEEQNGDRIFETRKFRVKLRDNKFGVGGYLRDITERKKAEEVIKERDKELEIKTQNLEETNIALNVLLKKRDEDKTELEEKVLLNIKELVVPYLEKLKISALDNRQKNYVNILESNLNQVILPFSHRLSSKFLNFTPTEIRVANLLRQGKTNKEIGELLYSSPRTIAFHREKIRKKLGLKNKKINLKSYLLSFA
ncbi:MAG: PAS domain S-box protein [Thermodesulfovibrionales bacterium]